MPLVGALDLFGSEVRRRCGSVRRAGAIVGQDLGSPVRQGAAHGSDLGHLVFETRRDGVAKPFGRLLDVADPDAGEDLLSAALVETLLAIRQQLADLEQWVLLPATIPVGPLLDPSAHLVDDPVGDPGHMEGIDHRRCVGEVRIKPRPVGLGQVQGHDLHALGPALVALPGPSPQLGGTLILEEIDDPTTVQVYQRGGVDGGMGGVAGQVAVFVAAQGPDHPDSGCVLHERGPEEADGRLGRLPAHTVLGRHRAHRTAQLADLAGYLGAGAG